MVEPNTVIAGDCIELLQTQLEPLADLIFADPPFNIGYKYDVYEDRRKYQEYYDWTRRWMQACRNVLKPAGSFWIAIGDDYAAEIRMIARDLDLHLRNWVIWHYTFGQNTKAKFARSHTHLFYFVNDPTTFTFNDLAVRTFSDRQRIYNDKRASKLGKIPDDVWSTFPRVCGTFGERVQWHPCQMPESLLSRIVRVSSNLGDLVLDPFAGSGTTLVVAKKLSRRYVGIELSENYVENMRDRLEATRSISAFSPAKRDGAWPEEHVQELQWAYMEAAVTTETLRKNSHLLESFIRQFTRRLEHGGCTQAYSAEDVLGQLERLRSSAKLGKIKVHA
ncbi:MAG: site-specific DNA-methyltransferase [Planctomycetes bacterium]|nr:site-specific DNA-methyltransferase [Planctomycetota bacterium]